MDDQRPKISSVPVQWLLEDIAEYAAQYYLKQGGVTAAPRRRR